MRPIRMPTGIGILVLIACVALPGCRTANSQVQLTVLESDAFSGMQEAGPDFKVITDAQTFAEQYRKAHAHKLDQSDPPQVDFKNRLVLVAFMGQQSTAGYGIQFDSPPVREGGSLLVTVRMQKPPPGAILAQVITSPYAMAVIDRGDYTTIKFVDQDAKLLAVRAVP